MPGFLQFLTGVYLMVGLTWFPVFAKAAPLYMAAVAFTAYGVHWFVLGARRRDGADPAPDGYMAIGFFFLSVLGILIFAGAHDIPVVILFVLLAIIYLFEMLQRLGGMASAGKVVCATQFVTAFWLMYLTYGVVFNMALGAHWWV